MLFRSERERELGKGGENKRKSRDTPRRIPSLRRRGFTTYELASELEIELRLPAVSLPPLLVPRR